MAPPVPSLPPGTDVWKVPATKAPPGHTSNLVNPKTNENIGVVTMSIFISLAFICVCLRLYVRFRISKHKPWWDDVALVLALCLHICTTGIIIFMLKDGMAGRHFWDTPLGVPLYKLPHWTTVVAILPQPTTMLVKDAILLFYLRLFTPTKLVRYAIYFGLVVITAMYIVFMFIFIYQTAFQNIVGQRLSWSQAAFNVATDIYIYLLPISGILRLHMPTKRKLGLIAIFSSGLAAIVMSCITLYWRVQYKGPTPDPTWTATTRMMVGSLEVDVGIMCACMPLFAAFLPKNGERFNFTGYFHSMRSRLLGSQRTRPSNKSSQSGRVSSSELVQVDGTYVELAGRKSASSSARDKRKEWFDGTTTVMDESMIDRNSRDMSHITNQTKHI